MNRTHLTGMTLGAILLGAGWLSPASGQGTARGTSAPVEIPAAATTLEGIPSVRVDLSADNSTRRVLAKDEASKNKLNIKVKNGQFFWASRANEPLALNKSGEYTFLSATPGNYITLRKVNDRITYVEHVDNKDKYITYFGELRIVVGK